MEINSIEELDALFKDKSGKSFPIPIEGNLALLAMGDVGIQAWRLKKKLVKQANKNIKTDSDTNYNRG